jgi:putative flippase GtrA
VIDRSSQPAARKETAVKSLLPSKPRTTGVALRTEAAGATETAGAVAPGPLASFARFVLCGGGVGLLSSGAVALLAATLPWALANALITVASTILCTELHARFTFGAGRRAGWRQHWQSAGSATAAYVVTCVAMFALHLVQSSPGMVTEQIVYLSASGLAGTGRFLVLRLFVFAADRNRPVSRNVRRAPARMKGIGALGASTRLAVS